MKFSNILNKFKEKSFDKAFEEITTSNILKMTRMSKVVPKMEISRNMHFLSPKTFFSQFSVQKWYFRANLIVFLRKNMKINVFHLFFANSMKINAFPENPLV